MERLEHTEALRRASEEFERRVAAIPAERWTADSPCAGWTARDVVNHLVVGDVFAVRLLDGASAKESVAGLGGDHLGDDPLATVREANEAQVEAFTRPDSLTMTVHHPVGDIPGELFYGFRLMELLVHGWDVATATGGDTGIDETLAGELWRVLAPIAPMMPASGMFGLGPSGTLRDDAPASARVLDAAGRRP